MIKNYSVFINAQVTTPRFTKNSSKRDFILRRLRSFHGLHMALATNVASYNAEA